ncbi:MAG: SDR family NAD(P)-dependent oxidoreductase [Patescibacteria group bacterium]|nr:SDR family NAD(P)-dependent oxidoreductase [Patescibacteria group bacterium]
MLDLIEKVFLTRLRKKQTQIRMNSKLKENMKFENKVVLITGASSGIGKGLAIFFADQGARVLINFNQSQEEAELVLEEVKSLSGEGLLVRADVTKRAEVRAMVEKGQAKFGQINILVNNVGGVRKPADWQQVSEVDFNETLKLNLTASFNCIREIVPKMKKSGGGKIVNISSIAGYMGGAQAPAYTAAKAGVINLTKAFAKELAPAVNVNCVAPGWINTSWHSSKGQDFFKMVERETPLERIGEVEDVVKAVAFLASSQADYITGHTLVLDGGTSLN